MTIAIKQSSFGKTSHGQSVTSYRITNSRGSYITLLDYGAILKDIVVPDRAGRLTDVALGYDSIGGYEKNPPHMGGTIGRNCNRISSGEFSLGGKKYNLSLNDSGVNNLHSGPEGYEFRMWRTAIDRENGSVTFSLVSPDGDQGFPGQFRINVTYSLSEDDRVTIHYEGTASEDTVVNMTNHSYFNLNGEGSGSVLGHSLRIMARGYTPVNRHSIPLGTVEPVAGTPLDFRKPKAIGRDLEADNEQLRFTGGFDHNFALDGDGFRKAAEAAGERSGITLAVYTDQPGIQMYAGNYLSVENGKKGHVYGSHHGFALETQHFPDSVNNPQFPSVILRAGELYSITTCYQFGVTH